MKVGNGIGGGTRACFSMHPLRLARADVRGNANLIG